MNQQTETTRKAVKQAVNEAAQVGSPAEAIEKKSQRTKIFVLYRERDTGAKDLTSFDFKSDLDKWLAGTNVEIIKIIRGFEKEIVTQTKVLFI